MFGIPLTTLISLAVTYGPEAVQFIRAIDPAIHQIVVAAAPLAQKLKDNFNLPHGLAVVKSVDMLAFSPTWTDDEVRGWWERAQGTQAS